MKCSAGESGVTPGPSHSHASPRGFAAHKVAPALGLARRPRGPQGAAAAGVAFRGMLKVIWD